MPTKVLELVRSLSRRIRPAFSRRFAALWLITVVNLALVILYFWSSDGSTVNVRVEAIGSQYRAFVDGRLVVEAEFDGRPEGGIGFGFPADSVRSLPDPSGIDSARVTDADTGEVLFEDTFGGSPSNLWEIESGDWRVRDGVFSTAIPGVVTTGSTSWTDYILETKLRNPTEATIYVRLDDLDNTVVLVVRPFRDYSSSLRLIEGGAVISSHGGPGLELERGQTLRSMAAMLLRPYPALALMVIGVIAVAFVLRVTWLDSRLQQAGQFILKRANLLVLGLALGAFVLLLYINYVVGEAMPHVPDSVAYVFQSKIFASFRITADAPPVRENFSIFEPPFIHVVDGRWFTQYPFAHPLFLAIGQLFGAVWLVPPVLGAACIVLIFQLGKQVYGAMVGVLAAILLFFSPFFQMSASNFMSHNTAVFVILASLFLFVRQGKRRTLSMFFSGVFLGLLFNMRPLAAVAFIPVLGLFMGYELLRAGKERRKLFREDLAFAGGGLLLLLAYFLYNVATTGSFTTSPQELTTVSDAIGFGGRHSVARGLQNEQALLAAMLPVANGWPVIIGMSLAALPFVLGTRNRWDYFLGASALALAGANVLFINNAIMYGPRFWYEVMPFLMLLTARGVLSLRDAGLTAGNWLASRVGWAPSAPTVGVTTLAVIGLVIGLVTISARGWMLGQHVALSGMSFVPTTISQLEGFNGIDRRLLDKADELDLKNALALVEECPTWRCYGRVFWTNSPDLDTDVVWAELHGGASDIELLEYFDDRDLYLVDAGLATIRPVTKAEIISRVDPEERSRVGESGEERDHAVERDQTRREDLERLEQALEEYAQQNGAYPDTDGKLQSLCVFRETDAGCALSTVLPELPSDPLGSSFSNGYWFLSDGATFVLVARQEQMQVENDQCPDLVARQASGEARYCVRGPAP